LARVQTSPKALSRPAPETPVVWDAQGTPRSTRFGDIYRNQGLDGLGGLAQSRHVFLQGCGLLGPQALWRDQPQWTLLETGFGLGLNFLATWAAWRADPHRPRHLHFVSVEAFPVTAEDLIRSVTHWPELQPLAATLAQHWWGLLEGVHRLDLDDGQVHLTLGIGSAEHRLPQLSLQADSVFLDGFSPDVNPELWSTSVLSQVAAHCRAGTRLSTWSVTRSVRETLISLGFQVERVPGLPPKRHALTACYQPPANTPQPVMANEVKQSTVGLSRSEARCLATVGSFEPMSVMDLAEKGNLNKGQASRAAQGLVDKGLVVKKDNPNDARGVALSLTPQGRRLWKPTMQLIEARNQQILGCLSPEEQATLSQWLDRLVAHNVKK